MAHESTIAQAQSLLARIALGDFASFALVAVAHDGSSEDVFSAPTGETFRLMGALQSTILDLHENVSRTDRADALPTTSA